MIRPSDLASLTVRQIIFHDVPNNPRGGNGQPTLTDTETTTDAKRVGILKKRLTQVFGSGAAFEVEFLASTASPVPSLVLTLTSQVLPSNDFIEAITKDGAVPIREANGFDVARSALCRRGNLRVTHRCCNHEARA
jgi:hypothetical protein